MPDMDPIDPPEMSATNSNNSKRKRVENYPQDNRHSQEDFGQILKKVLSKISGQVMLLEKEVKSSYKLKKEIIGISTKLSQELEKIGTGALDEWINKVTGKENEDGEELLLENLKLRRQIRTMEGENKAETDYIELLKSENARLNNKISEMERMNALLTEGPDGERCKECQNAQRRKHRRTQLTQNDSFENFQDISEEEWSSEIFPKPNTKREYIWNAPTEWDFIFPCDKNFESSDAEINRCIEKFGGREGLRRQNKTEGEVAFMLHALGFPASDGTITQVARCIYYPILSDKSERSDNDDATLFKALKFIKTNLLEQKRYKVAILEKDDVRGLVMTRMLQYLFTDTPVEITMYKAPQSWTEQKKRRFSTHKGSIDETKKERKNSTKQDAILISMKDKSYADLLKTIKTAVNPNELGVEVQNMKRTKKGDLILTVQNGTDKAEVLKKELNNRVPEATASLLTRQKILHLKGMDETVNEREIKEAISRTIGKEDDKFEVRALRPAYGGKQNATLKMLEADASKLLQAGTIRIGWTKSRVVERENILKCTKCWESGHSGTECRGPDRSLLCLKCGKEGHKISECLDKPYCLNCETTGHRTGSKICKGKPSQKKNTDLPLPTNND